MSPARRAEQVEAQRAATLERHLRDVERQGFPRVISDPTVVAWLVEMQRLLDARLAEAS